MITRLKKYYQKTLKLTTFLKKYLTKKSQKETLERIY